MARLVTILALGVSLPQAFTWLIYGKRRIAEEIDMIIGILDSGEWPERLSFKDR